MSREKNFRALGVVCLRRLDFADDVFLSPNFLFCFIMLKNVLFHMML